MIEDVEKRLKDIQKKLCEMLVIERKIEELNLAKNIEEINLLTERFVTKSEKLTCMVRDFAMVTFTSKNDILLRNASKIQGVTVAKKGEIIEIEIPFLLPKKKLRNSKFLSDPLYYTLNSMPINEDFRIGEKAVVCFTYIYSKNKKNIAARDYDNIESKKILDVVALFALKDDGAEFCDIFHRMDYGVEDKTKISIMPERCFWNMNFDHRKRRDAGEKSMSLNTVSE